MDGYSNETRMQQEELLSSEKTEFRREVGLFGGISVLAGIMIGSGNDYLGTEAAGVLFGNAGGVIVAIGLAVPAAGLLLYELVFKRQREVSGELCQEADGNI